VFFADLSGIYDPTFEGYEDPCRKRIAGLFSGSYSGFLVV
jgi:hypothetical protein